MEDSNKLELFWHIIKIRKKIKDIYERETELLINQIYVNIVLDVALSTFNGNI